MVFGKKKTAKVEAEAPKTPAAGPADAPSPEASASGEGEAKVSPSVDPSLTKEQQAAIDQIMAEARQKAQSVILGGSMVAGLGTPSTNQEETQEAYQRDRVPGKFRRDKTWIPETIEDDRGRRRKVLLHNEYKYAWVPQDEGETTFLRYIGLGYRFCLYDGGSRSGLGGEGFQDTGEAVVTRMLNGRCRRGDCYLMYIPIRAWEALVAEDAELSESLSKRMLGVFHNAAYSHGVRPTAEIQTQDGVRTQLF